MTTSILIIIGKISILIYLVVGFFWIWKRIINLFCKFIDWVHKKNVEIHIENYKMYKNLFEDEKKDEDKNKSQ